MYHYHTLAIMSGSYAPDRNVDDILDDFVVDNSGDEDREYVATSYIYGDVKRSRHNLSVLGLNFDIYENADDILLNSAPQKPC